MQLYSLVALALAASAAHAAHPHPAARNAAPNNLPDRRQLPVNGQALDLVTSTVGGLTSGGLRRQEGSAAPAGGDNSAAPASAPGASSGGNPLSGLLGGLGGGLAGRQLPNLGGVTDALPLGGRQLDPSGVVNIATGLVGGVTSGGLRRQADSSAPAGGDGSAAPASGDNSAAPANAPPSGGSPLSGLLGGLGGGLAGRQLPNLGGVTDALPLGGRQLDPSGVVNIATGLVGGVTSGGLRRQADSSAPAGGDGSAAPASGDNSAAPANAPPSGGSPLSGLLGGLGGGLAGRQLPNLGGVTDALPLGGRQLDPSGVVNIATGLVGGVTSGGLRRQADSSAPAGGDGSAAPASGDNSAAPANAPPSGGSPLSGLLGGLGGGLAGRQLPNLGGVTDALPLGGRQLGGGSPLSTVTGLVGGVTGGSIGSRQLSGTLGTVKGLTDSASRPLTGVLSPQANKGQKVHPYKPNNSTVPAKPISYKGQNYQGQCSVGPVQCCNHIVNDSSTKASFSLVGDISNAVGSIGLECVPIAAGIAAAISDNCKEAPVCCQGVSQNGLINVGCSSLPLI